MNDLLKSMVLEDQGGGQIYQTLLVTTKQRANSEMRTVIYPVRDLVDYGGGRQDFDSLIDLITTTLAPTTWDEVGGPGSIAESRVGQALVISQTAEVHESVQNLLAGFRRTRAVQGLAPILVSSPSAAEVPRTHE